MTWPTATEDQLNATTTSPTTKPAASAIEVTINGEPHTTSATTLSQVIGELDFTGIRVATALNGDFVPAAARDTTTLASGDKIEIVSARQGG